MGSGLFFVQIFSMSFWAPNEVIHTKIGLNLSYKFCNLMKYQLQLTMKKSSLHRRKFIRNTSFGILGAGIMGKEGLTNSINKEENKVSSKIQYRRLGRTDAFVSDIGTGAPENASVLRATLETGVNFIETSESYGNGRNEEMIGRVIKDFDRKNIFLATKAFPAYKIFKSVDDIIQRANASLKRLQMEYIDLYMIHQAQNIVRVKDEYFHAACDQLKKEGKIRHVGLSCHGQPYWQEPRDSLEDIMMAAIEDGRFDVLFFPYNFMEPDMGARIMEACKKKDIGSMIMKSNPVTVYEDYEQMLAQGRDLGRTEKREYDKLKSQMDDADQFFNKYQMTDLEKVKDGAIQFILTNENVSTICCRFSNYDDVSKYSRLSGTTLNTRTAQVLGEFKEKLGFLHCKIGCNACESSCPHKVPINTIMRYNYYFTGRKQEKYAIEQFRKLTDSRTELCADCEGFCESACPYGVAARPLISIAHQNLNMANHTFS